MASPEPVWPADVEVMDLQKVYTSFLAQTEPRTNRNR